MIECLTQAYSHIIKVSVLQTNSWQRKNCAQKNENMLFFHHLQTVSVDKWEIMSAYVMRGCTQL